MKQTSLQAFDEAKEYRVNLQYNILGVLAHRSTPCTSDTVRRLLGDLGVKAAGSSVRTRLSELEFAGLVTVAGTVRIRNTDREKITYKISHDGLVIITEEQNLGLYMLGMVLLRLRDLEESRAADMSEIKKKWDNTITDEMSAHVAKVFEAVS